MSLPQAERSVVHVVPHTHWDREWYEPFQTFRMRLVTLIDDLLARMGEDPRLVFTLDGQAATVDDYLEVRPEAEPFIRALIAEGRLAIGPWQILMDEFLVSGETIVRNLQLGWRRAESLGRAMPIGYLPDMFGHIAQMPQILRRAGIDDAVVWRGVPTAVDWHAFSWSAPDGSTVRTEYLVGGYGNAAHLFDVPALVDEKIAGYRDIARSTYGERSVLAMYGTDHAVPSAALADLVAEADRASADLAVRLETLADYLAAPEVEDRPLPSWTGELRSAARANMLPNVVSARIDLKVACARAERALERYAEPFAAIHGGAWPERLLELAWRRVVDNSAHDSICGCSHDDVVAQVLSRFAEAQQIARGVTATALSRPSGHVPRGAWLVANPSPAARTDLVEVDVAVPDGWAGLALRSASRAVPAQELQRNERTIADLRVAGADLGEFFRRRVHGRELFGRQINRIEVDVSPAGRRIVVLADRIADPPELDVDALIEAAAAAGIEAPEAEWQLLVRAPDRRTALALVEVPPLGLAVVEAADSGRGPDHDGREFAGHPPVTVSAPSGDAPRIANGLVEVIVNGDGTLRVSGGGATLDGVGRLVDGGDAGDSYNYGPPPDDRLIETPMRVAVEAGEVGPLRGSLRIVRGYAWPAGLSPSGGARSTGTVEVDVTTTIELRIGEPFVRIRTGFENRARDHRVRWHVPLPVPTDCSAAEGQYAVVERGLSVEGGHGEVPLATFPARGFVHAAGVSILLDHVVEYELVDGGELALTLLRSTGLISRNANPYREDPAGPEIPIPAAQLIGPWSVAFALMPHAGRWADAGVLDAAERYQHPLVAVAGTADRVVPTATGTSPEGTTGLEVGGRGIVMASLRRAGEWLEVRLVAEHPEPGPAVVTGSFTAARNADLLGIPGDELEVADGRLVVELRPWEIRTIQLLAPGD